MSTTNAIPSWVEPVARVGYATKGIVYLLIGGLAGTAALHLGGQATDSTGALVTLLGQPFGEVSLWLVTAGLAAYSAWRFVQGLFDAERKGRDLSGVAVRLSFIGSGLIHAGLAWTALKLSLGSPGANDRAPDDHTRTLLSLPFGSLLVAAIGCGVLSFGLVQFYKSYSQKFCRRLEGEEMTPGQKKFACSSGQFGLAARGVAFLLVGSFFLSAAWRHDPSQAGDLGDALRSLETLPYGSVLLVVVAVGLAAYGLFMFVEARFHRMNTT